MDIKNNRKFYDEAFADVFTNKKIVQFLLEYFVHEEGIAREESKKRHKSLNSVLLDALSKGLDADNQIEYHDMDDLAGTWVADPGIDAVLDSFNEIDEDLWK